MLAGCAASVPSWREDAYSRFNSALSAGSQQSATEETDNIRQTLELADRYYLRQLFDDSDRLYKLSCQKSQLLYRNLVLSKVRQGSTLLVQSETASQPEEIAISKEIVSISKVLSPPEDKPLPIRGSNTDQPVTSAPKPEKKLSRVAVFDTRNEVARKIIYLTFDDGPSRLTLPIAAYLNSEGIKATFFALGSNVKGFEKVVRKTVALGHLVGNHTLSHDLRKLNGSLHQGVNEIEKTAAIIDRLGGDGKLVRIPYGASSKALISSVAAEGGQIFDWDIDSLDTSKRGVKNHAFIEQAVLQQLRKSSKRHIIMLFHDGGGHDATLVAIRKLVPRLKQEGYRFGLLSRNDRVAQSRREGNPMP